MILIEKVLGNAAIRSGRRASRRAPSSRSTLDHWEAQKNRFRKKTGGGDEIAVSLDRGAFLRDGDVLLWDAAAARAVVARISLRDVMIIHLDATGRRGPRHTRCAPASSSATRSATSTGRRWSRARASSCR